MCRSLVAHTRQPLIIPTPPQTANGSPFHAAMKVLPSHVEVVTSHTRNTVPLTDVVAMVAIGLCVDSRCAGLLLEVDDVQQQAN